MPSFPGLAVVFFGIFGLPASFSGYLQQYKSALSGPAAIPAPPPPEPIVVTKLPLPPVVSHNTVGACLLVNHEGTGCIQVDSGLQSGNFLPDNKHIVVTVMFGGAPTAPHPASIYTGKQVMLLKTDNTKFPNGATWKCITCGVPIFNQPARNDALDYPQAFNDGRRILAGTNIIDCGLLALESASCTPKEVHIYPIRWNNVINGTGPGGIIRELRIHPDDVHLGFSSFGETSGQLTQYSYFSRLQFNPLPSTGTPFSPRYDLINVTTLFDPAALQPITTRGSEIMYHPEAISVGEFRGFSKRGKELTYLGYPQESSNIDIFAVDLTSGQNRRITSHPEYVDPVDISPDDMWAVIMDTRGTDRQMWMSGMRGIPPLIDMISSSATASTRNNGRRRFFQPWLIDRHGDRGSYFGQRINAAGDGSPGSINDPEWNGRADPRWSNDGTHIVFTQELTIAPACGGVNPLPCYDSTEPGGRIQRIMLAHFPSRTPLKMSQVSPVSDIIPWGIPYQPESPTPVRPLPSQGIYTLRGKASGSAIVNITLDTAGSSIRTVHVEYHNLSDDGINSLNGVEEVTGTNPTITLNHIDWYSNLKRTGTSTSTKKSQLGGFHLDIDVLINQFNANGTLTTTIDGIIYRQPLNRT